MPKPTEPERDLMRDEIAALDALLREASPSPAPDALKARIMEDFDRPRSLTDRLKAIVDGARRFPPLAPAGALGGAAALGLAIGVFTADQTDTIAPEYEVYAYAYDNTYTTEFLDEIGSTP
ncbi:MAG: hypothetical protein AAGC77_10695 [Pseudomonadota bacterium]